MYTSESMMKAMMMNTAAHTDAQELSGGINSKHDGAQAVINKVTSKVKALDTNVRSMEEILYEVDQWRQDMKHELLQVKAEAIAEAWRVAAASSAAAATPPRRQRRSTAGTGATQGERRPILSHISGFAPFCEGDGHRIGRHECLDEQRINTIIGEEFELATRWLQPLVRNHALSFEILAAEAWREALEST